MTSSVEVTGGTKHLGKFQELVRSFVQIRPDLMFPHDFNLDPEFPQGPDDASVALKVLPELRGPERAVRLWQCEGALRTPMPVAPVDENRQVASREVDVGSARQIDAYAISSGPEPPQRLPKSDLATRN